MNSGKQSTNLQMTLREVNRVGEVKKNVPKLRFKGYEDSWEQRKFGDVGTVAMCKRIFKEETSENGEVPFYKIGTFGGEPDAYISREVYEKYKTMYPYPKKGDILISASGSIGRTVEYTGKDEYFQDSNIVWLQHNKNIDNSFLKVLYSVVQWSCEGSTIKRLYNDNFLKTKIVIPNIKEQMLIGECFGRLDNLITLHQRKYDALKSMKKTLLSKMFPKNGEDVPEIRFKGFTDAWEQRKFSEIALRESTVQESSRDFPSVEYEDVIAEAGRLNKDVNQKEVAKKGIVFDGSQVLYGKLRPYLHNWLSPDFSGVAVGDWWVLKPVKVDKSFLYRLIQTQQFDDIANQSTGSKMPRADWNLVSNLEFAVPVSGDEQSKIGGYFSSLDTLITLHQRKLDELKNMKKTLLQQMFV